MGIGDRLREHVARELAERTEPWAKKLLDADSGRGHPEIVAALAQVGIGLERDAAGNPLADDAFLARLASWVVDTALVDPDAVKNAERSQFQTGVRVQFDEAGRPRPGVRTLDTLAELALGAYGETHPRAARIASPEAVVREYLRGAEPAPQLPPVEVVSEDVEVRATAGRVAVPAIAVRRRPAKRHAGAKKRPPARTKTAPRKKKAARRRGATRKKTATRRSTLRRSAPRKRAAARGPKARGKKRAAARRKPAAARKRAGARAKARRKK
jgi:hypothetical protein